MDILLAEFYLKSFLGEARAVADIASDIDRGQEVHLHGYLAIAFAGFTTATCSVE